MQQGLQVAFQCSLILGVCSGSFFLHYVAGIFFCSFRNLWSRVKKSLGSNPPDLRAVPRLGRSEGAASTRRERTQEGVGEEEEGRPWRITPNFFSFLTR